MKAVDVKTKLVRGARGACHEESVHLGPHGFAMLDLDWIETQVSEVIWHEVLIPLQREIEDDDER